MEKELGPASVQLLEQDEIQALIAWKLEQGFHLEDAILSEVYMAAKSHPALADEFLNHFLKDLLDVGRPFIAGKMRRHYETQELVDSIVGNLWEEVPDFRYKTRGQFLSFLATRMRWRALTYQRQMYKKSRREDLRIEKPPSHWDPQSEIKNPRSILGREEDLETLAIAMSKLSPHESEILSLVVARGVKLGDAAERMGLTAADAKTLLNTAKLSLKKALWKTH